MIACYEFFKTKVRLSRVLNTIYIAKLSKIEKKYFEITRFQANEYYDTNFSFFPRFDISLSLFLFLL